MRRRTASFRAPVAILLASALVALSPGSASADENLLEDVVTSVTEKVTPTQDQSGPQDAPRLLQGPGQSATLSQPSSPPPAPTAGNDDDIAPHETNDPEPPDHGQSSNVEGSLGGEELVTVGDNRATVEDDDSTTAESTLIAIGGEQVIGAQADSEGENNDSFDTSQLDAVCEESEGQLCLRLLYSEAEATDDGQTSYSRSQSHILSACAGGSDPSGDTCNGPVRTGVAQSEAEAERDQQSGRTTASSESSVANACVADPETGVCAVEAAALHSEGESDSGNSPATARRSSYLLMGGLLGEQLGPISEPEALMLSLTEDCADGQTAACLFLNQGETYLGDGIAGHAQEALHVSGLPGVVDLELHLARTESLVHNDGGEPAGGVGGAGGTDGTGGSGGAGGPGMPGAGAGDPVSTAAPSGVLPNAGGFWSGLIALALLGLGSGALLMAYSRRRMGGIA